LSVFAWVDTPAGWELAVSILREEVIFAFHDNVWRYCLAIRTNTLNDRNLFTITRLLRMRPSTLLALYEVLCLLWSDTRRVTYVKEAISHISYVFKSRWKPSINQVNNPFANCLLF
ncbi:hypothetical protein CTA1_12606, partial [Colletotrichum tanaceti]